MPTDHGLPFDGECLERLSELVRQLQSMDGPVAAEFFELTVGELKRLARTRMRRDARHNSLRTTEVLHEAVVKLFGENSTGFHSLGHFMAVATLALDQALVDRARARNARKRPPRGKQVPFDEFIAGYAQHDKSAIWVRDAFEALRLRCSERAWIVARLHHVGGLTWPEIAAVTDLSVAQVRAAWAVAKEFLGRELR